MKDYLFRPSVEDSQEEKEREAAVRSCPSVHQLEGMSLPELEKLLRRLGTSQMIRDMEKILTNKSKDAAAVAGEIQTQSQIHVTHKNNYFFFLSIAYCYIINVFYDVNVKCLL